MAAVRVIVADDAALFRKGPKTVEACVRGVFTTLGLHRGVDDDRRALAVPTFLRTG